MDGGNIDDVKQLLVKLAVIAEQVDTRSDNALQRIEAGAMALDRSAHRWTTGAEVFSQTVLNAIGTQARDSIAGATRQALGPLDAQLRQSTEAAKWAAEALAEQRKLLTRAQQSLVRKGLLALLAGSLLAAGGIGYVAWRSMHDAALGRDALQALRSGALARCPGGQSLCARVGPHPRRSGGQGEYLVVLSEKPGR